MNSIHRNATPWQIFCWCLFDWASSPFFSIIITFIFSNYFVRAVVHSSTKGTVYWAWAMGVAGFIIALLSPLIGSIADYTGYRKLWLGILTIITILCTAMLWFTHPNISWLWWALFFVIMAQISLELGQVFYNSIMAHIAPTHMLGRISGWGWGSGYIGGICCLTLALVVCIHHLPSTNAINIRSTSLLVALWFALFSLPLFIFTPDRKQPSLIATQACRRGLSELKNTIYHAKSYRGILLFLIAHLVYIDGLNTLFAVGGTFAGGTFNMSFNDILLFAITLNITAGIGAILFAWVDDYIGPKLTIIISLLCMMICGGFILLTYSTLWFWILSGILGIFVGPTQAASRSYMAHIAPPKLVTQMFGLFNFSGRISSFIGPFIFGTLTAIFHSQRAGMFSVVFMMLLGLLLILPVPTVFHSKK